LTYKPGTDTLRRSASVETCTWLSEQGALVSAFDPAVHTLPEDLNGTIHLCASAEQTLRGADAAIVATAWPQFQELSPETIVREMRQPLVIDPARHLEARLRQDSRIKYYGIGMGDHATRS
jgi:UDPglucose 6-dehydrogenase